MGEAVTGGAPPPGWRPTRRDLLRLGAAGALSWSLPLTGCPPPAGRPTSRADAALGVGGRIHGQDEAFGHLLRSGDLAGRAPGETREVDVLVVGAGVAGLACAWRLRREGVEGVLLLDAGQQPGGNARWGENQVSRYPWGAHYLRAPTPEHRALERFLEEVGLIRGRDRQGRIEWDTRAVCWAPHERLFEDGRWGAALFPPPSSGEAADRQALAAFEARVEDLAARPGSDGRRAFALPADLSSRDPDLLALDRISFAAWLDQEGLTRPALRWLLEYACRDDYGCTLDTTSAWAGLHYFCARRGADRSREVVLSWPEGNGRLVDLLQTAASPARIEASRLCFRLLPGDAPGDPSEAWAVDRGGKLTRYRAQHLVWAGPQFVLRRLLPEPPPALEAFTYAPWLVANVTLDEPPGGVGSPLAWDNVFYGRPSLGYVVANREAAARGEPTVVTWYRPFTGADPDAERRALLDMDHAAIVGEVVGELLWAHPTLAGKVRAVDAWRWGHAMIRPVPGFLWGPERAAALRPQDYGGGALVVANSDLSGIPVSEEAFYRGVLAGEEVLRRRGASFESLVG